MVKRNGNKFDVDQARSVIECHASGAFEELFDVEWRDAASLKRAALDYVRPRERAGFERDWSSAFPSS